jgi:hypothetical protein
MLANKISNENEDKLTNNLSNTLTSTSPSCTISSLSSTSSTSTSASTSSNFRTNFLNEINGNNRNIVKRNLNQYSTSNANLNTISNNNNFVANKKRYDPYLNFSSSMENLNEIDKSLPGAHPWVPPNDRELTMRARFVTFYTILFKT